jgi:hypothetical protein
VEKLIARAAPQVREELCKQAISVGYL